MTTIKTRVLIRQGNTLTLKTETPKPPKEQSAEKTEKKEQTKPETPEQKAAKTKHELASNLPMKEGERGGAQKQTVSGTAVVAAALAPQLGSSPEFLHGLLIDERKLSVLNEYTQTAYGYFNQRGKVDNVRFWIEFINWELPTSQALNGLARRHILEAIRAASGAQVTEIARRPNLLARNTWRRDWQNKADREGKQIVE